MMNRIEKRLQQVKERGDKAFITYMTAGLPDMPGCADLVKALDEAQIDVVELGIPFSDPVADGPVIQAASFKAIQQGTNLRKVFDMVEDIRADGCQVPLVFMMYFNTVTYYGMEAFVDKCIEVSVDGLIIPDLPYEEKQELEEFANAHDVALISMIAPTSESRIQAIASEAKGFIYVVSSMGVTGIRSEIKTDIGAIVESIRKVTDVPCAIGFGISTPEQAKTMAAVADGAIVGSAIVKIVAQYGNDSPAEVYKYVKSMKDAVLEA